MIKSQNPYLFTLPLICVFAFSLFATPANEIKMQALQKRYCSSKKSDSEKNLRTFLLKARVLENLGKITDQKWDVPSTEWVNVAKTELKYDGEKEIEEQTYAWSGTEWKDSLKLAISYNSDDSITSVLASVWDADSNKWIEVQKAEYTYSYSRGPVSLILYKENFIYLYQTPGAAAGLNDLEKDAYTYNTDGTVKQILIQAAFPEDTILTLADYLKVLFTYDSKKNPTEVLTKYKVQITWLDVQKQIFTYNSSNKVTESTVTVATSLTSGLVNYEKYLFTYTNFDSVQTELTQEWDSAGAAWKDLQKILRTYNSDKLESDNILQVWEARTWTDVDKFVFTYDNKILTIATYQLWENNAWSDYTRKLYNYGTPIINSIVQLSGTFQDLQCFNSHQSVSLRFGLSQPAFVSLSIYDCKGNCVASLLDRNSVGAGKIACNWNLTNTMGAEVSAGVYIARLSVNNSTIAKPVYIGK